MVKPMSLVVSPKVMADVNASQSMSLKIPTDGTAVQKGIDPDATYTWIEQFLVQSSNLDFAKENKERYVFELKFKVPDDTPYPTNAGRVLTMWYRVNPTSLSQGEGSDDYKMSIINLGRLKMLVRACGFELPEGSDIDIAPYFIINEGDAKPPVVGTKLFARMVDKPGKDKDGNANRRQEPTKFVSEGEGGSL